MAYANELKITDKPNLRVYTDNGMAENRTATNNIKLRVYADVVNLSSINWTRTESIDTSDLVLEVNGSSLTYRNKAYQLRWSSNATKSSAESYYLNLSGDKWLNSDKKITYKVAPSKPSYTYKLGYYQNITKFGDNGSSIDLNGKSWRIDGPLSYKASNNITYGPYNAFDDGCLHFRNGDASSFSDKPVFFNALTSDGHWIFSKNSAGDSWYYDSSNAGNIKYVIPIDLPHADYVYTGPHSSQYGSYSYSVAVQDILIYPTDSTATKWTVKVGWVSSNSDVYFQTYTNVEAWRVAWSGTSSLMPRGFNIEALYNLLESS